MSNVSQQASISAAKIFGTVAVTADSVSNAVQAIGNAFEVANVHSSDWLASTKLKSKLTAVHQRKQALREVALSIANSTIETETHLAKTAGLRTAYDAAYAELEAALS